jgi:two-component system phosphate regulon sensor histidine kinase PhoR
VKKRLRWIMVLMAVSIVGANLFQGYWLYQAYNFNHRQMSRQLNIALGSAISRSELNNVQRLIGNLDSIGNAVLIPVDKKSLLTGESPSFDLDSLQRHKISMRLAKPASSALLAYGADSVRHYADTLARRISNMLIMNKMYDNPLNIRELEALYREELKERNIVATFRLDTLRISGTREPLQENTPPVQIGESIITRTMAVNPLSRLGVRAEFPNPATMIISRMTGTLLGSLVLLIITTWAFVYMLRTILQQKRLSEIKSDFINNMTHELKTPIATVSAAVEALERFDAMKDPQRSRDYLEISRQELQRLSSLVEKVLNIALEDRREFEIQPEPVHVLEMLESIVQRFRIHNGKRINISLEHNLADPIAVLDSTHFANAIQNLVDNAIKYSYDSVDIRITCTREDNWLKISVGDNGIGIPKTYQQHIFEQFFRVPQGDLHNVKGFGLGLAYVKKIVDHHGGKISVKSEPRHGSEFLIAIPQG